jgi:hypothetical protein
MVGGTGLEPVASCVCDNEYQYQHILYDGGLPSSFSFLECAKGSNWRQVSTNVNEGLTATTRLLDFIPLSFLTIVLVGLSYSIALFTKW